MVTDRIPPHTIGYRLFFVSVAFIIAPFVIEEVYYGLEQPPPRFNGDLYFAEFWLAWGIISVVASLAAAVIDKTRIQGMALPMVGLWFFCRAFQNLLDRTGSVSYVFFFLWLGLFAQVILFSVHLAQLRPVVEAYYGVRAERRARG